MSAVSTIKVQIVNADIWSKFGDNNEMVVNKLGRNLFPTLAYNIEGMEPTELYCIDIAMMTENDLKYKFIKDKWLAMSQEPSAGFPRSIQHPDGYKTGEAWMKGEVSFAHLKITSDEKNTDPNQIYLEARRKYSPVLNIRKLSKDGSSSDVIGGYGFTISNFIAVTAYKNPLISDLKKVYNKHASGVRTRKRAALPQEDRSENAPKRRCPIQESPDVVVNDYPPPHCVPVQDFNDHVPYPPQTYQYDLSRENSSNSSASSQVYPCNSEYNYSPEYCPPPPPQSQQQYFEPPTQFSSYSFVSYDTPLQPVVPLSNVNIYPPPQLVPPVQPNFQNPPQVPYFEQNPQPNYEPKCYDTAQSFASQVSSNSTYYY